MTLVVWVQVPPPVPESFFMKIEELKQTKDLNVEWKIVIPAPEINIELSKKYSDIQKELKIPGFRPGKVPINIIKKDILKMFYLK